MKRRIRVTFDLLTLKGQPWYLCLNFLLLYGMKFFLCVFLLAALARYKMWTGFIEVFLVGSAITFIMYRLSENMQEAWKQRAGARR